MPERSTKLQLHHQGKEDDLRQPLSPPLVLSIDDQLEATALVQMAGRRARPVCSVLTASSGVTGLDLVRAHAADVRVVVLDVRMPDLDGRWLCGEIRRLAPQAQILPLTADETGATLMARLGALPPMIKPVSAAVVADALSQALTLPPPVTSDRELEAFFSEQLPQQLAVAQQRPPQVQAAVLASEHLRLALCAALPAANARLVAAASAPGELQPYLATRRVQLLVASADCQQSALALAIATQTPLLICATSAEAPALPASMNVVSSIAEPDILATALCTVATGGHYRESAVQHPLLAALSPREREVITLIRAGHSVRSLATNLGVSYDHARHLLSDLYTRFAVPSLGALRSWLAQHDT